MARRVITRELFQALVNAFREDPGNIKRSADKALCGIKLAKRAWNAGWPQQHDWARPIKVLLEEERFAATARGIEEEQKRRAEQEAVRARAQAAAIEAFEQEATVVRQVRGGVMAMLTMTLRTMKGLMAASEHIDQEIMQGNLAVDQKVALIHKLSLSMKRIAESAHTALEVQRKHVGAPEKVLRVEGMDGEATPEDLDEELQQVEQAARRVGKIIDITPRLPDADVTVRDSDAG